MTSDKLQKEMTYQLTMIQADKLLKSRIITEEAHQQFKAKMLEKYQPFISRLSS
ncbi:SHOCT domain-containing protein [Streptococcus dysgalactiae]|uniref:SHOCT domain-containing protein n=1 Tax=Streptococcus dysgalactiae TaxID=1334 RepID=UPI003EBEAE9E